ncbi:acyl-CoA reductase-like NAD-dependent aldehyde dehydrogenase [Roseiarcus fermentans]|uniref:Acyl-CoA reductase-like NAD-dependent aldehyde dehydrogenase n=1 Tax=Roseiarcus fermentans TaxID=1473586 RepID=A0A366F936_9HYPH|nr:aldehyde dehydrogenase family protein [Roseiarcus fermentans]RBP11164.1 acyl-CoA reductase-like NAD-dependent aldehyde dehydrogenase [Roseiarcus fermentans]
MTRHITCISPVDGRVYVDRPTASEAEIRTTLERARAAQKAWRRVPLSERIARVIGFVDVLKGLGPQIAEELAWQMGRPIRYGQGELRGLEERARYMAEVAPAALAPVRPIDDRPGFERYVAREPVGLVFTIAPWNYPYLTTVNSVVPALIAGNAVLLKSAAQTLLVGDRFQQAFAAAGLPEGLFTHIVLGHSQTEAILSGGQVDHVAFTGSVEAGRAMERAAAGTFTTLGLELGGKDPAYVAPDANLTFAIENLVDGAFFNSGQCCCGIERIYVHEQRYDAFVKGFVELTAQYALGDPLDPATTLGPMARTNLADVVRAQTREAIDKGARAHIDPGSFPRDEAGTPYLAPQVLTDVDHTMAVMREESFGPVIGIARVRDEDEAIALMNDSPYGLTASVWTEDVATARRVGERIETGTVYMNRCDYLDPGLAWTGVKDTGYGASLSSLGYGSLTRPKSYHLRLSTGG